MKKITLLLLFAVAFTIRVWAQTCNYLAYESFTYPAGAVHGLQGGTGWSSPWNVQGENTSVPGFEVIAAPAMTYTDLQTAGNYLSGGYQYLSAGRQLNTAANGPFAPWLNGNNAIGQAGTTLWGSVMLRKTEANNEEVAVYWHRHTIQWCWGCSSDRLGVGYFGSASNVNGERRWSLYLNGTVYPTTIPMVPNETAFLVVKMEFGPTNTISLYVNPATLGNAGPPAPSLTQTTTMGFDIRSVAVHVENNAATGHVDEFRMGATYACVAPDAGVVVNQPPTASFTMNPASGTAPLNIAFDGSASSDPENAALTYTWNFGDGSPTVTGATVNHTFTATGVLNVTLTVADPEGVQHSLTQSVTVYNQWGTFTCQLGLVAEQMAACGQSNGRFSVTNYNGAALTLRNAGGNVVNPVAGNANLYGNLAVGNYVLTAVGNNGCRDTFALSIVTDSSTCAGWQPQPCAMQVGVGIEGMAYYSVGRPFKDFFKSCGTWITYDPNPPGGNFVWNTENQAHIPADANGYPTVVPFSVPGGSGFNNIRGIISAIGFIPQGVPLRLLYDGVGTLQMQGAVTVTSNTPGQIDFTINDNGNVFFNLTASQQGNHVRNIRVVAISDLATYETQPFRQGFIEKCTPFNTLRFMDWMHTNNNDQVSWANRTLPGYYSQAEAPNGGVAYEYIIQLANQLDKDIWICVPHQADDNYITQMATMFRDQLDPGIKVYLEYSNEVWNWIFEQAHWVNDNGPQNISYPRRYVERSLHAFDIWHNVWGAQSNRVQRVLGTQAGYDWVSSEILSHADQSKYDYFSPSWYFGLDHGSTGNPNLQALGAAATAEDVLTNSRNAWLGFLPRWHMIYNTSKLLGKKVINYEGGQHFTDFSVPPYIQAMYDAQIHPNMYNLYDEVMDTLRRMGSEMPLAFVLTGPWQSVYGSWGHIFDDDDPAPWTDRPKFQVLMDQIALCSTSSLPVELAQFDVQCVPSGTAVVRWSTTLEKDLEQYTIQGSLDGETWYTVGAMAPRQAGNYKMEVPHGAYRYFRLKMTETNANATYSPIVAVECPGKSSIRISPNPNNGTFNVQIPEGWSNETIILECTDIAGKVITRQQLSQSGTIHLGTQLPAGTYIATFYNSFGQKIQVERLLILKNE